MFKVSPFAKMQIVIDNQQDWSYLSRLMLRPAAMYGKNQVGAPCLQGRDPGNFMSMNRYNHPIESIAVGAADRAPM